uniref:interleukin-17 receptor A-like n=1 Tax=Doryrhamphus excisus TaxID=161450 RepID=UPI0025AE6F7C|nr:interleukin-17 receptor A-like [Doryrhamphus excisus]
MASADTLTLFRLPHTIPQSRIRIMESQRGSNHRVLLWLTAEDKKSGLAPSSFLGILNQRPDCDQAGLDSCQKNNCSVRHALVPRQRAPTGPEWGSEYLGVRLVNRRPVPVMNVTWTLRSDASILTLQGSELRIVDTSTKQSVCVYFTYSVSQQLGFDSSKWTFSLAGVVVEAGHSYMMSAFNLPEPDVGDYRITKQVTVPGCNDKTIRSSQMCLENGTFFSSRQTTSAFFRVCVLCSGSLWHPEVTPVLLVGKRHLLSVVVGFRADVYSDLYQVSIENRGVHLSQNVPRVGHPCVKP